MKKPPRKPTGSFPENPPAPPRWGVVAMWAAFLIVVVVAISNVLPIGRGIGLRGARRERKLIESAQKMEQEELWTAAAELYENLAQDSDASMQARATSSEIGRAHV